ncbi:histone acetyltransferase KAT6A-like [Lineus longissimus]|uniref:histone acetyltransferase KAT6A-like n=1 Tax=Lineus longissimus TaxID=88925 RepID=UPI002B4DFB73
MATTSKMGSNDWNTKRKKTPAKPPMKVNKSPKKNTTKSSKSTSSNKKPNNDKKAKKVVSKKTSPKKTTKAGTKKTKNDVKPADKKKTSPIKAKPKADYKTRHHIGRRKATENVISYSQSGTTFFDLYTDYKTFNISKMKFPTKRGHDDSNSVKLPPKKLKLDRSSMNSGKVSSPSKDKENSAASKEKKNIEKLKRSKESCEKGLKIQSPKKNKESPSKKGTEKSQLQKKGAISDENLEGSNKVKKPSPRKKVVTSFQAVAPRGPWVRRQASLNASAVMTVLYERERGPTIVKETDDQKTPVKSHESSSKISTKKSKDAKKVSKTLKLTSKCKKESTKKEKAEPKNRVSRTNKKSGKVQEAVAKSKGTCRSKKIKGPYRFRELKNLLDCDNNDLDCDVLKSIQQGFFSKGMKRKINSSDIQLGVFAHKKREASLNAQAMLAASCGRVGGRRIGRDYSSSETSSDSEFFQSDSDELDERSSVTSSEVEADDDSDEIIDVVENDEDEDMRAARVLPDSFKITRHVATVHHTHEILGHWVDGLGIKESLMCKDSIEWTNRELLQAQPQVTPVSPGNGIIVPVSQVTSPRMEVIKVTPRPSLQTPPLQSSPMQSSSLLINGMVAPGGSPLPNGMIGPGGSPLPTSYSYNNGAIIPSSHCQSFTLNGLGSISLMATYPNRYDSAFRVPSFNNSYYQHPGCYSQNSPIMQPVQDRYTHIVHHPIPVQPQQDLEIIFHHHNSHQTIKPCCSKTETVTCTVTHTQQQHVNQKQPCKIQESFPPSPASHQPLPPLPPPEPPAPQQFSSQQSAHQQFSSQQVAPQNFPSQQTGPQQYPTQQSAPQHFQQQVAPQQYPRQQTPHQYPQQQVPQQYPSLSAPQQFSHQQSGPHHFQHQKSTQQFSQYTSSTQQFPHQASAPQQFQPPPQSRRNPYPSQQSHQMQNPAAPSNQLQTLPANMRSVPVNKSLPPCAPRYHTLTAPPPKNTPDAFRKNLSAPQLKSLPAPPNRNSVAPQVKNQSMPQRTSSHSVNLPAQSTHNAALPLTLPGIAPKNAATQPKPPALHPIPKPYTHPMPQTVPRPIGQSERELRKRPRSVTAFSGEGRKRMCLNPVTVEIPMDIQVYGVDKNDTERTCHRRKERTEPAAREPKKRLEESEGFAERCESAQKKDSLRIQSVERKRPERLSPRLSKEKPGPDVNRLPAEQASAISPKEKSATNKTKQKVTEKTKEGGLKSKVKSKPVLNNNSKGVANNNKKTIGGKTKLLNSKKCMSAETKLLSNKKKVGGQRLTGDKKVLKSVTNRPKLSLKKADKQKPKLLKKKTATGQKAKLLKSSGQGPKHLNLKKSVAVSKGPKHCKTSPSDKSKTNIKKEKKRVDAKSKTGGVKAGQEAGSISSRRGSNRKQSLDNSWQWVGEPENKLVFTCNEMPGVERPCYSAICHNDGDIIKARDCVLLRSGPRKKDLPFIAKITAFFEKDGEKMMSILWYYRPEHTEAGRQPNHLPAELFASKHKDENSIACIEDKCLVMSVGKYCRYRAKLKLLEENLPFSYSKQTLVPKADDVPTECLPTDVDPETVFLCRSVYDFRQKRILKNPS